MDDLAFSIKAKTENVNGITKGTQYFVLNHFHTKLTGSGLCVVIKNDKGDLVGYCASHFETE